MIMPIDYFDRCEPQLISGNSILDVLAHKKDQKKGNFRMFKGTFYLFVFKQTGNDH